MPLLITVFSFGGVSGAAATFDETSWMKGTIDSESEVSNVLDEAIDTDGFLHVSYYDSIGRNIMYATNSGGIWVYEVVDEGGDVGRYNSIAVGGDGKVHISYYDATLNDLKYARGNTGQWSIETVDSAGVVGEFNSIACDDGNVYITYRDHTNSNLKMAESSGSGWDTSTVVENVNPGNSMIASAGQVHVAYVTSTNQLSYATKGDANWTFEQVDTASSFGNEIDIDLINGRACILYYDTVTNDLKLATRGTSGVWGTTVVDDTTNVSSWWLSLDAEGGDTYHVTYYDPLGQNLCYAFFDGEGWEYYVLDETGGTCSAVVSDQNGKQHIVYIDLVDTSTHLSYVTNSGATWAQETLDEDGIVGEHSSIAVDADGNVHIAYYDNSNSSLKYANNVDGWNTEVVDNSSAMMGMSPSLTLDEEGNVHISYHDGDGARTLKYATNAGGSWDVRTLDGSGDVGIYSSIAIDHNGKVHIAYLNSAANNLKYTGNAEGDWIVGIIENSGTVTGQVSLAVDSLNMVHVVYYRGGNLSHAYQAESSWAKESLDSSGQLGFGLSMFIDPLDQIYVTYYNKDLSLLKYINDVGGQWGAAEIIESDGVVGIGSSIKVDERGDEHIVYVDSDGSGVLKYAEKRNGIWMYQKIDLSGCGNVISMAIDSQDRAHVSYYNPVTKDLRYTTSLMAATAPTNLTATVGDERVTLNWNAPDNDGGAEITEYAIFRSNGTSAMVRYTDVSGSVTTFTDMNVENGIVYTYSVAAVNSEGNSQLSNQVSATPCTLPGAPDVDAKGKDKAVQLDWDEPDTGGAAIEKYNIYRKNETGIYLLIATVEGDVTSYKDTGLENGKEYFYYVTAVNPAGEGSDSDTVSATPEEGMSTMLIIAIIIVVLAAVGVGAFFFLKKSGRI